MKKIQYDVWSRKNISPHSSWYIQVWYHGEWCKSRGRNCYNTNTVESGGCCKWFDEKQMLADIEEHLGVTIPLVGTDFEVQTNEFDGKVVYGKKMEEKGKNKR